MKSLLWTAAEKLQAKARDRVWRNGPPFPRSPPRDLCATNLAPRQVPYPHARFPYVLSENMHPWVLTPR